MSNVKASQALQAQREAITQAVLTQYLRPLTSSQTPYAQLSPEKITSHLNEHLIYLAEALAANDPILYHEYLAWVKVVFAGWNVGEETLFTLIESLEQALHEHLPIELAQLVSAYLATGCQNLQSTPSLLESFVVPGQPLADLAARYLQALLNGDRRTASAMILQAAQTGTSVKDIYLQVFQPCQREIGRLWQTNRISVAQEHFCTAATQLIMSQLYPYIFASERKNRHLVVGCVGGELHEIGARMVADFFELEGWDTYFLGANTPPEALLSTVDEQRADILALSTTMTFHVSKVAELIGLIRQKSLAQPRVLVGGYPFNLSPTLWQRIGADGFAPDAATALREAERLLQK